MATLDDGRRFIVIGENIHATRVVLRTGKHVTALEDGRAALAFTDADGSARRLVVPEEVTTEQAFASGKVKHVRAAILAGMSGRAADAADGAAYLAHLVRRQVEAGADYLDLNVDEVSQDMGVRCDAMRWLVGLVARETTVAVSLDSSDVSVIRAGLEAAAGHGARPLLNSASLDRLDVLELAADAGAPVVVSAAGSANLPSTGDERVANATAMIGNATGLGIPLGSLYVDSIVLPVAVSADSAAGKHFLDAVERIREAFGPEIHLTGGLSNVSFGLPMRRLVNDVFLDLAVAAGADSGIIDPIANDLHRALTQDRASSPYRLAADALTGHDPFCVAFLTAFRKGELGAGSAGA